MRPNLFWLFSVAMISLKPEGSHSGVGIICLRFGARFSGVGIICLRSGARLCMGCRSLPEIWGTFMHSVHNLHPDLGHINEKQKWNNPLIMQHLLKIVVSL